MGGSPCTMKKCTKKSQLVEIRIDAKDWAEENNMTLVYNTDTKSLQSVTENWVSGDDCYWEMTVTHALIKLGKDSEWKVKGFNNQSGDPNPQRPTCTMRFSFTIDDKEQEIKLATAIGLCSNRPRYSRGYLHGLSCLCLPLSVNNL